MNPKCPNCDFNEELVYSGDDRPSESGEMYYVKVYECCACGCEYDDDELEYLRGK